MQTETSAHEVTSGLAPPTPILLARGITLIHGRVGSGKSNLLAHLAQAYKKSGDKVLRYANPAWDGEREIEPPNVVDKVRADVVHLVGPCRITCLVDDLFSLWENAKQAADELGALQDFARDNRINLALAAVGFDAFTDKLANNSDTVVAMDPFSGRRGHSLLGQHLFEAAETFRSKAPAERERGWFIQFEDSYRRSALGRAPLVVR